MEARVPKDPAIGNPCGEHRQSQARPRGPSLRAWVPALHLPSPPVIGNVAVHEPADVIRHPADDIHSHNGSCRTGGEGESDRANIPSYAISREEDAKLTTAFPWNLFPESRDWKGTLRLSDTFDLDL